MDEFFELFGNLFGVAIIVSMVAVAIVFIGMFVAPIALIGGGGLFYAYNIHLPEKRRKEARGRTEDLYAQVQKLSPSFAELRSALVEAGIISADLHRIAKELYDQEGLKPPALPPVSDDAIALARYQDELQRFANHAAPAHFKLFKKTLIWALSDYEPVSGQPEMFHSQRKRSKLEIERLILRFVNDDGLFGPLNDQLNENYRAENEVMPTDSKFDDYAWRYLRGTPLLPLAEVDEMVGLQDRMYHTYLLGSSGSGKTNLLENIIAHDLASDEDCCVIVIDSQTQLTEKLAKEFLR